MTDREAKLIELHENEKLRALYEDAIAKAERGEPVNYTNLLLAEKMALDTIMEAMKKVKYSDEWIRYINNPVLKSIAQSMGIAEKREAEIATK